MRSLLLVAFSIVLFVAPAQFAMALNSAGHESPPESVSVMPEEIIGASKQMARSLPLLDAATAPVLGPEIRPARVASPEKLAALDEWNLSGTIPRKNGFEREIEGYEVRLDESGATGGVIKRTGGKVNWAAAIVVGDSYRLRLKLSDVNVPAGTKFWITNGSESVEFGTELMGPDGLWTPSVGGPRATLIASVSESGALGAGFKISSIMEIVDLATRETEKQSGGCLFDATCVDQLGDPAVEAVFDIIGSAIAHLVYVKNGASYVCSGGLLTDTDDTTQIPYLLTANHCFDSQSSASSLEAFWNYKTSGCLGSVPSLGSLPRSNGSSLLATSSQTDFSFVRLNNVPGGQFMLGWTNGPVLHGDTLLRISHPAPEGLAFPQMLSVSTVDSFVPTIPSRPRPNFVYEALLLGTTYGGSSGSPVINVLGQVVGQLWGITGPNIGEPCDNRNSAVDGAFSVTYPSIAQWLNPATGGGSGSCSDDLDSGVICLGNGRFKTTITWRNPNAGNAIQPVKLIRFSDIAVQGYFSNPANVEVLVKIVNGCGINGHKWVFAGGLTNQNVTVTVRDTQTGFAQAYENPKGTPYLTVADAEAFSTCP